MIEAGTGLEPVTLPANAALYPTELPCYKFARLFCRAIVPCVNTCEFSLKEAQHSFAPRPVFRNS